MVLESEPQPFVEFLREASVGFVTRGAILAVIGVVVAYLVMAVRYGPVAGASIVFDSLQMAVIEFFRFSPRRVMALSRLAVKEALRRRVLFAFGLFALLLLFGGWFIGQDNAEPAKLYLHFVLSSTMYLVLLLAIFLSTMSLPTDFKDKTIYTVVTKPVHSGEIVLGRILGFSAVGTGLLLAMGFCSYIFVIRAFNHTHELTELDLKPVSPSAAKTGIAGRSGETQESLGHKHDVSLDAQGNGWTGVNRGHRHEITAEKINGQTRYVVGPPEELFVARVPKYANLRFRDKTGNDLDHDPTGQGNYKQRGISVGKEWTYQSFIEGSPVPQAAAIWTFANLDEQEFPDGIPLEMTIRVFRTHKGDVEKGIRAGIVVKEPIKSNGHTVNPPPQRGTQPIFFRVKDGVIDHHFIARKQLDQNGQSVDVLKDLVVDGRLEIWVQCFDGQQYLGVAKADLYIRAEDASFEWNFVKGFLGIWCSMVLVTAFGVMFSTFLSAPVALLATIATMILGFAAHHVVNMANSVLLPPEMIKREDKWYGGGPLEAMIRIWRQDNVTSELPPSVTFDLAKDFDKPIMWVLRTIAEMMPNYTHFDNSDYVVQGFNTPGDVMAVQLVRTLGYLGVVFVAGYLFLKTREVAK